MKINSCDLIRRIFFLLGLYVCMMFSHSQVSAQQQVITAGLDTFEVAYNVRYEIPENFNALDSFRIWGHRPVIGGLLWVYWEFESEDKQCKVLYRALPLVMTFNERIRDGLKYIYGTEKDVPDNCLRFFTTKKARDSFNADSVCLYDVPTAEPDCCDKQFTHCTQMLIFRQEHFILEAVWYFTDQGKKRERKYIRKIHKRIWFNDGDWKDDHERMANWHNNFIIQYKKSKDCCGI